MNRTRPNPHAAAFGLALSLSIGAVARAQTPGATGTAPGGSTPSGTQFPITGERVPAPRTPTDLQGAPADPTESMSGVRRGLPRAIEGAEPVRGLGEALLRRTNEQLLNQARLIADPADRALAFDRAARSKMLYDEWQDAEVAIREGGQAAIQIGDETLRGVRLTGLVRSSIDLSDELVSEAVSDIADSSLGEGQAGRTVESRIELLDRARAAVSQAAQLCQLIPNTNAQSHLLTRLATSLATSSQRVARYVPDGDLRADAPAEDPRFVQAADQMLVESEAIAWQSPIPIFRDQNLVKVVAAAAGANQYDRAAAIARRIPQPESRADAQIRLAETMARSDAKLAQQATSVYQEAVTSVVSIPLTDPRATLGTVLLDSLVSVGRFDDALATATLVRNNPQLRTQALGLIARAMGSRGMSDQAYAWIDREPAGAMRDRLRREVMLGQIQYLEVNSPSSSRAGGIFMMPGDLDSLPSRGDMP